MTFAKNQLQIALIRMKEANSAANGNVGVSAVTSTLSKPPAGPLGNTAIKRNQLVQLNTLKAKCAALEADIAQQEAEATDLRSMLAESDKISEQ